MYGGVGRGKSFLMDCFFNAVPLKRKVRLHFHEFMREVHRELAGLQGTVNPLDVLGARIAKRYKLICFDEFHVADITDAMILHRLLAALFDNGVGFVTTSNFKPDDLYPDGLHRDRILPAIALLNEKLEVVNVDNGTDYRRRTLEQVKLYHTPLGPEADAEMNAAFDQLAEVHDEDPVLHIERARSGRGARRGAWCGLTSGRCAVARGRRTTTWRSPRSSTRCCCRMCPICRSTWRRLRGALPGWWTCCTTGASSSSCRLPCRQSSCTPKDRWPHEFPRCARWIAPERDAVQAADPAPPDRYSAVQAQRQAEREHIHQERQAIAATRKREETACYRRFEMQAESAAAGRQPAAPLPASSGLPPVQP
jgi:hypothetical protein